MSFKVKSAVQALDPMSGIWLPGVIVKVNENNFNIKWTGYNETSVVTSSNVRKCIIKRKFRLNQNDWKNTDPRVYQKGDQVIHRKPDGSTDLLLVEENDPWNCRVSLFTSSTSSLQQVPKRYLFFRSTVQLDSKLPISLSAKHVSEKCRVGLRPCRVLFFLRQWFSSNRAYESQLMTFRETDK